MATQDAVAQDTVIVHTNACLKCGNTSTVFITEEEALRLASGMGAARALITRPAAFRELLITGIHEHCWNELFPPED